MRTMSWAQILVLLLKLRTVIVLLALLILFSVMTPTFLTANNLSILAKHVAISALHAVGMTFVVLAGGIDLSVGSVAGLSGMVAGGLLTVGLFGHLVNSLVAIVVALFVSSIVGLLNGTMITRLGVAPFIFKAEADAAASRAMELGYRVRVDAHNDDAIDCPGRLFINIDRAKLSLGRRISLRSTPHCKYIRCPVCAKTSQSFPISLTFRCPDSDCY